MIKFGEIFKDKQIGKKSVQVIDFRCYHCDHRYSADSLNIAVFLYGFFSLHKRYLSYTGITCPSCMKTILVKENRSPSSLFNFFSSDWVFDSLIIQPQLRYFTPISQHDFMSQQTDTINKLNVGHFSIGISEITLKHIDDNLNWYTSENGYENHLYSFVDAGSPYPPIELIILFVDEDNIEKLVSLEEEKNIRLIPRYIHKNNLIQQIEEFCVLYGFEHPLERMMGMAKANIDNLKKIAKKNNWNLENLLSDNPEILPPETLESIIENANEYREIDFGAISSFMNILASDPYPCDLPGCNRDWIKGLWKQHDLYKGQEIPLEAKCIKKSFNDKDAVKKHEKMVSEIQKVFSKGYIQSFLSIQYPRFIKEYSRMVNRYAFSYADIWQLKERYLEKVNQCIEDKKATRPDYRDKKTWRRMAKEIWSKNPEITIAQMSKNQEIRKSCEFSKHAEKTIRNWIKDLCPDRSHGRRPKKRKI